MFAKLKNILKSTPAKLTGATVKRLIGHTNIVYYNCETNVWNTNTYNGYRVRNQELDTGRVKEFKSVMEHKPEFNLQYEFSAPVIMTIDAIFIFGQGSLIANPQYKKDGTGIVGNIIVKNKATGKYEMYCKSWVGVDFYCNPDRAADNGAGDFVRYGARNAGFRQALHTAHTR